jgi:hypothetical protein
MERGDLTAGRSTAVSMPSAPARRRAARRLAAGNGRLCAALVVPALLVPALSSCSLEGLDFVEDDRLSVEGLEDREETDLPIELSWTLEGGFRDDEHAFAVIVDRTPPRPGRSVESLLDDDPACSGPQGCPEGYLERNRIFVTDGTSLVLDGIPEGTAKQEGRGFHEVTIVLVDAAGVRVGEIAESVRFRLPGRDA